jgi:hypothetical protein
VQNNARWAGSIFASRKSFEMSYYKSQEHKVCMGNQNPLKDRISEEIALFTRVHEIPVTDLLGEQRFGTLKLDKSS